MGVECTKVSTDTIVQSSRRPASAVIRAVEPKGARHEDR